MVVTVFIFSAQMVAQVDPAYASFSPSEQVVALIRQNAALEVRVASYSDAHLLQQRLEDCQQVCDSLHRCLPLNIRIT
jgi:hypothetical protein